MPKLFVFCMKYTKYIKRAKFIINCVFIRYNKIQNLIIVVNFKQHSLMNINCRKQVFLYDIYRSTKYIKIAKCINCSVFIH